MICMIFFVERRIFNIIVKNDNREMITAQTLAHFRLSKFDITLLGSYKDFQGTEKLELLHICLNLFLYLILIEINIKIHLHYH